MRKAIKKKISRFKFLFRAGLRTENKVRILSKNNLSAHHEQMTFIRSLVKIQNQQSDWIERMAQIGLDTVNAQKRIDKQVIERIDDIVEIIDEVVTQMKKTNTRFDKLEGEIDKIYQIYNSFHAVEVKKDE